MTYQAYSNLVYGSMIIIFILTVLSVINRLAEGKKLRAKCLELIEKKSFVTGRLIEKKRRSYNKKGDRKTRNKHVYYLTYAYTVNGIEYMIKKRYKTDRRREFPPDPAIYFEPDNPAKGYIEGETDVYTAGSAVMTFFRAAFLLWFYWVILFFFLPKTTILSEWLHR